jgi:hypothetical protein
MASRELTRKILDDERKEFAECSHYPDSKVHVTKDGEETLCGRDVVYTEDSPLISERFMKGSCKTCEKEVEY